MVSSWVQIRPRKDFSYIYTELDTDFFFFQEFPLLVSLELHPENFRSGVPGRRPLALKGVLAGQVRLSGIGCLSPRTLRKVLGFVEKNFSLTLCLALLAQSIKIPPGGR